MKTTNATRQAMRAILLMAGALLVAGGGWPIASSLGMHTNAGSLLCAGGVFSMVMNLAASVLAWRTYHGTSVGDRSEARARSLTTLVLCPPVLFVAVFVFETGRLVLAGHAR